MASVEIEDILQRIAVAIEQQNAAMTALSQDGGILNETRTITHRLPIKWPHRWPG